MAIRIESSGASSLAGEQSTVTSELLDEVLEFQGAVKEGFFDIANVDAMAGVFREQLRNLVERYPEQLETARKGYSVLLGLGSVEEQIVTVSEFQKICNIDTLLYDLINNQIDPLLELEDVLSGTLDAVLRTDAFSEELLEGLLEVYNDILEHLWLLPQLSEEPADLSKVFERSAPAILSKSESWFALLSKYAERVEKLVDPFHLTEGSLRRLSSQPVPHVIAKVREVKQWIGDPLLLGFLGQTYFGLGYFYRTQHCTMTNLKKIEKLEKVKGTNRHLKQCKGQLLGTLGAAYQFLGRYPEAIELHEKALAISQEIEDRKGEGQDYGNLGNAYQSLGRYPGAIELHTKALAISQEIRDRRGEGATYGNLGNAYLSLGRCPKAIESQKKHLEIAKEIGDRKGEGKAYGNLGNAYQSLGRYPEAIESHEKRLAIALEIGDCRGEGAAYGNLGNAYQSLGRYPEAIESHEKALAISQEIGDRRGEGSDYGNLGNAYQFLGRYAEAIESHEKRLAIAMEIGDRRGEGAAYGNLGNAYQSLGRYPEAIESHEKALAISQEIGDISDMAIEYHNLAIILKKMGQNEEALTSYKKSIDSFSEIRMNLKKDSNKITIFEQQSKPHLAIEDLFSRSDQVQKALLQTESRRALSLADSIAGEMREPLNIEKLKEHATTYQTTLVYFSLAPLLHSRLEVCVWLISSGGKASHQKLPINEISEEISGLQQFMKDYPFSGGEGRNPTLQTVSDAEELAHDPSIDPTHTSKVRAFRTKLMLWYDTFIEPIEELLPDRGARLTIMLDGFLSQLPFAIFWDGDEYLIEKYEISFAPSVQILNLLERRRAMREPVEGSLVVGNPIPGLEAKKLPKAEEEAGRVLGLLGITGEGCLCRDQATVLAAKAAMKSARFIHFACHGDPNLYTNIHSVYRGGFLMTPDEGHKDGVLHAEEIAKQKLSAELVFLSSCHSGRGKIQREGVIGHMRSFLAAGADSVVGTLWTLPDSDLTVDMVEKFYTCIREKKTKSAALREMMLLGIERDRGNPQKWGAFFLTGLTT